MKSLTSRAGRPGAAGTGGERVVFSTRCGTVACRDHGCPRCCVATTSCGEELRGAHRVGIEASFAALARHQRAASACRGRERR